jgi:ribosomal protein S18 acetylase RimI-like enzyme
MLAIEPTLNRIEKAGNPQTTTRHNGHPVTIRMARMSDVALIDEMHDRISQESMYYRYLGIRKPSQKELQRLCALENENGIVIVATVGGEQEKVIGLACFRSNLNNPEAAEPAVLVEDHYQGCGVGKKLLRTLYQHAVQRGIEAFECFVHPTNRPVFFLVQRCGLPHDIRYNDGLKEIRIWLKPDAKS